MAFSGAGHLRNDNGRIPNDPGRVPNSEGPVLNKDRADPPAVNWPQSGQAAFVLGDDRPSASPYQQPAPIASLANIASMLAATVAGSEARFPAEMNAEAHAFGMNHTIYTDPSGYDPRTVSTAADQLRVFQRAMRFPVFRQIVSMDSVTLPVAGTLTNFNPLVAKGYAGKTGSDSAAGGCMAFLTQVNVGGHRLTAAGVVMGQGKGSDTSAILAAAGQAAEQLVDPVASASRMSTVTVSGAPGGP